MERHLSGWMNRGMDRQTGDWSTGEWVGRETDKWVNRQREGWTDRQACCTVPTAQPGFRALASPIAASCLLPVSPTFLPPKEDDHRRPWPFPPAQGVPSPPGDPADPSPSPGSSRRVPRLPAPWAPPLLQQLWGPSGAREGGTSLLGAVSCRWWQRDFSLAGDDSQESHVFPG